MTPGQEKWRKAASNPLYDPIRDGTVPLDLTGVPSLLALSARRESMTVSTLGYTRKRVRSTSKKEGNFLRQWEGVR